MRDALDIEMADIVLPGKIATFFMGSEIAEDEKPIHEVNLTIPFAMSTYEITNKQFYQVLNWAIEKEYAIIFEGDVWDHSKTYKYLGIKNLNEGLQEGIEINNNRLTVKVIEQLKTAAEISADEFPVHGVTWYGACAFCNFLSLIKGLEPAYDVSTWECDWTKNGYRLPTEAEWAYTAKASEHHKFAWGDDLHKASCTFNRSIKLFSNGLTPVGFYDGTEKYGIITACNASPFGVYD